MKSKLAMRYTIDGIARKQVITFCTWQSEHKHCIFDMSKCDFRADGVPAGCHLIGKKAIGVEFVREG